MPLVEVIGTQWTSPQAIDWTMSCIAAAGKMPVHVKKDVPGFIGNRLQHALWREAIALVEHGICDAETVDTVVKAASAAVWRCSGLWKTPTLSAPISRSTSTRPCCRSSTARPGPSPYLEKLVAERPARLQDPAKASANGRRSEQAALRAKVAGASQEGARGRIRADRSRNLTAANAMTARLKPDKVIITCAITGSIHTPTMSDALPVTPDQIAEQAIDAAEAGAAILHLHARDPKDGRPTPRSRVFMQFLPRIKQATDAVVNITTGGG